MRLGTRASLRRALGGARSRLRLALLALGLLVTFLVAFPLVMLVIGSFLGKRPTSAAGNPLQSYILLLGDLQPLYNTMITGVASTAIAVALGVALAWILVRTNVPGRGWLTPIVVTPFYLTPVLGAVGWSILASPGQAGLLNAGLSAAIGWAPLNIYSASGIVWVMALYYTPFCFLFTAAALKSMDPALEESARVVGGTILRTAMSVSLPVVLPAILGSSLLIFVQAIGQFGVPAVLGMPYGFPVITTRIYEYTAGFQPNYAAAAALGLALFAISAIGVSLQAKILAGRNFATVTGRGFRPRVIDVKRLRWPCLLIVLGYILAAVIMPLGAIIWGASLRFMVGSLGAAQYTWDNISYVLFEYPVTRIALRNSLILAFGGATLTLLVGGAVAWLGQRTRLRASVLLEYVTMVPLAVPGMVFSLGLLWAWIRVPLLPVYGTLWILLICHLTIFLPYAVRSTKTTLMQIDRSLEECANVCGATPARALFTITMPLIGAGMGAAWTLLFISIVKELSASALLSNSRTMVLSVAIFELWTGGSFNQVAALALLETVIIFVALLAAKQIGRVGSLAH